MKVAVTLEQCWHRVPGGTAVAALETVRALAEREDLDLVGVSARHRRPPPRPWVPSIPVCGLPLPRVALYEAWHRRRWPPVQRATGPVDVIHATGVAVPPRSAPLVWTVHDLAFLHDAGHFTRRGVRFFRKALDVARAEADLVLCSSEATRRDCEAAGFDPDRLRAVPLGVHFDPVDPAQVERVRRAHGLDRPYVLWTGTVEPRKNLRGLVSAFQQLDRPDLDLVMCGPSGWGEDRRELLAPVGERARLLGFVPGPELNALYAGAEVFCYPSLREGFGLPVLEAMAQGTPVVTSAGTSTEELAAGGAGLLVDPTDAGAIAGAMARVLGDRDLAASMAAAGRHRAREYPWSRTAELVAAAYAEAVGQR